MLQNEEADFFLTIVDTLYLYSFINFLTNLLKKKPYCIHALCANGSKIVQIFKILIINLKNRSKRLSCCKVLRWHCGYTYVYIYICMCEYYTI